MYIRLNVLSGKTLALTPTDVSEADLHCPVSQPGPDFQLPTSLWEGSKPAGAILRWGFYFRSEEFGPASSQGLLRGPSPAPFPPPENKPLFYPGGQRELPNSYLGRGTKGLIELCRSPAVGRSKPGLDSTPSQGLEGPDRQFLVLRVSRGRGRVEETLDGGVQDGGKEGGVPAPRSSFPRLKPGISPPPQPRLPAL